MIGKTLGHYKILERLGGGGFGEVYRARDERLHRDVAIKQLSLVDAADERLLREARAASALQHRGICAVYEIGNEQGTPYLVMELVPGRTIEAWLAERKFTLDEVARIGADIADALAHAHEHRVLHRDLKSSNVMLTPELEPRLLDFGLARRPAGDASATLPHLTQTAVLSGTPAYMAPELLRGAASTALADVWSLGVVLHQMLTGELPFPGRTTAETIGAVLHAPRRPLPPGTPPALAAVIGRCLEKDPAQRIQSAAEVRDALRAVSTPGVAARARRAPLRRAAIGLGAAVVTIALVVFAVQRVRSWEEPGSGPGGSSTVSLAVLPLENQSGDARDNYFAAGMTDELTATLGQIGALKVIAHNSVASYDPQKVPLRRIAHDLGVAWLVTGSVFESGDRVRIVAQLVEAGSGRVRMSRTYERRITDVLALQNEVSTAIAQQVRAELTPREQAQLARTQPVDPEAYQDYLRGRLAWESTDSTAFTHSIDWFRQAIARDPNYAAAYAGIADADWGLSGWILDPNQVMPAAHAAAERAVKLDPQLPEGHVALATVLMDYDFDWPAAEREFQRAIDLNPNHAAAHRQYAWLLRYLGRAAEDSAEVARAVALDPLSEFSLCQQGWPEFFARRYRQAADAFTRSLQLYPQSYVAHEGLGLALEQLGEHDRAVQELQENVRLQDGGENRLFLAHALAVAGRGREARAIVATLGQSASVHYVSPCEVALVYIALGERERALGLIERAYREHGAWVQYLRVDPRFDPLRGEPRFQAVVARLGSVIEGKSS